MPELEAVMPVKHEGKRIAPGEAFTVSDPKEAERLIGNGAALNLAAEQAETENAFDLADALQKLISEGHDIAGMNMTEIKKLLGADGASVKRAEVDAALDSIVSENMAAQASTELVAKIVDVIKSLGPDALDENGAVDPAKIKAGFAWDQVPSDEAIAAAVAAMALTAPEQAGE
ncbi:hypothetical protein ABWH89_05035 [Hoeflea alexandrii]|uniref:hypothetical protein n=1 Tax=Hoeflea alexandrii TaxID=288436 RepID=UPI0035D01561